MYNTGYFSEAQYRTVHVYRAGFYLSTVRVEGGAAAALTGEGAVQADDLIGGLVTDCHVEGADVAAEKPGQS